MAKFHDLTMNSITGEPVKFSTFKGKTCLVVNVASQCGLTPQYKGLQTLHDSNKSKGLTVLGFPCNQFGKQEPGTNEQICEFATSKYATTFPMFEKIEVNGDGACDLYKLLKAATVGDEGSADIAWTFSKFLVDGNGKVVARFGPRTTPEEIAQALPTYL
jgi:glutathione peroxidase-family protein